MKYLWLTTLSFLQLHGAGVAFQSICRWPRSVEGSEALRLPQAYLAHNHDPLPRPRSWLFAAASWHISPSRRRQMKERQSADSGVAKQKKCWEILLLRVLRALFLEEAWLAWQPQPQPQSVPDHSPLCSGVFPSVIWHFCVGMYLCKWKCAVLGLFYPSSSISLEGRKISANKIK